MGHPGSTLFPPIIVFFVLVGGLLIIPEEMSKAGEAPVQSREDGLIVTGNQNIVSNTYNSIWIDGGTLTLKSSSVGVTVKESLNITGGGSLIMEEGSKLRIQNGTFDASDADRVEIRGDHQRYIECISRG